MEGGRWKRTWGRGDWGTWGRDLQVSRLPQQRRSRPEKFLTLFNQAWCTEQEYILDLKDVPKEFKDIAQYLSGPAMDQRFRAQLEGEWEI